jgi:NADH dehydrogenase FAD-containing subunit
MKRGDPLDPDLPVAGLSPGRRKGRAVLVGAGHAHLEILRRAGEFTRRGFELTLIAPDDFWYSGLATGMLGGLYPPELDQVDAGALVQRGGGRFIRDRAIAIDVAAKAVRLASGESVGYDVVSLNLGSEVPAETIPGLAEHAVLVKPIRNLWHLRQDLEVRFKANTAKNPVRVVIIGGGATACELTGNLLRLAHARAGAVEITLLAAGTRILEAVPPQTAESVHCDYENRGVAVEINARASRVEPGVVCNDDGRRFPFDILVGALGLRPSPLVRATGLPTSEEGALLVDSYLRSVADPAVFGGGDCVALQGHRLARVGVYAVRQAPILAHNLLATLNGRPLRRFRPQKRFLLIMNLGDDDGLATWGPFAWRGRTPFRIKDRIDRRFLARYR